jgi:hypothetical protein
MASVDGCGKSCPLPPPRPGFDPWTVQPIASPCTDYAILVSVYEYSGPLTYKLNSFPRAGRKSRLFFPSEIMEIRIMRSETPEAPLT